MYSISITRYELPFGASKRWLNQKGPVNWVLGGWQFNGILTKRSGFPTDIRSSRIAAANQIYATLNVPDRVSGVSMYLPNASVDGYFNPAAFVEPQQVRNARGTLITLFGNSARRVARGPGSTNLDFSLVQKLPSDGACHRTIPCRGVQPIKHADLHPTQRQRPALTIGNPGFGKLA